MNTKVDTFPEKNPKSDVRVVALRLLVVINALCGTESTTWTLQPRDSSYINQSLLSSGYFRIPK